jgi:hypothetical protein
LVYGKDALTTNSYSLTIRVVGSARACYRHGV